ncbi:UDP-N-acetylmuramoyl-L-alanine--D-glutamate ligase [Desulfallas thermosapovorans]|uniref:UDP-N-acetylmuramoylalanine--D-glutamate ligase n=1 Tax=Desulfallas thermosapovorans DSM 6562 TaxID=1121431 RepID=A0A5S4ZST6_9FIRM|nr:UDP-N-acetylmuramoyl-L-alanine--D-glutamate ligase [Desulfallas thermosapovorans]TYO95917.1 UDP-N-acetylmuramoylalanine--D-glutamate ligase [Desulfallas thermosapovorans DSM 6562]
MNIRDKKVLVVGAGRSGTAVARFLLRKGARVVLTDNRDQDKLGATLDTLLEAGLRIELGNYPAVREDNFDLVVISPGVPPGVSPVASARQCGIPVLGELELAYRFARAPVVAITGTNGKTTTTTLVGEIFRAAGLRTLVGGNIGVPLVDVIEEYGPEDMIVAEVSSFQLETAEQFHPRVAVILNITPDHLDRHGTMEGYIEAKARIFARQDPGDFTVLNYDDPETRKLAEITGGKVIFFSHRHNLKEGVLVRGDIIVVRQNNQEIEILPAREVAIPGLHNLENAMAAVAATYALGVKPGVLARVLRTFAGVAHRLETVAQKNGVLFVNDSKGTNPDASIKALQAFDRPIILLAGGRNKGSDFTEFARLVKQKVRVLVVLGECAVEIEQAARAAGCTNILKAPGFREAVLMAHASARPGDVVLLSPACASWDMFKNFEERGDLFREIVTGL